MRAYGRREGVAPHVGAWIEIHPSPRVDYQGTPSHPTWVRGLKLLGGHFRRFRPLSHPTWVRGLKSIHLRNAVSQYSRTPRGCVD